MKAIKKPVPVEVWRLPSINKNDVDGTRNKLARLLPLLPYSRLRVNFFGNHFFINTLEGDMVARPGDYIVQGRHDDVWVVQKDIFEDTYEVVEDDAN